MVAQRVTVEEVAIKLFRDSKEWDAIVEKAEVVGIDLSSLQVTNHMDLALDVLGVPIDTTLVRVSKDELALNPKGFDRGPYYTLVESQLDKMEPDYQKLVDDIKATLAAEQFVHNAELPEPPK